MNKGQEHRRCFSPTVYLNQHLSCRSAFRPTDHYIVQKPGGGARLGHAMLNRGTHHGFAVHAFMLIKIEDTVFRHCALV